MMANAQCHYLIVGSFQLSLDLILSDDKLEVPTFVNDKSGEIDREYSLRWNRKTERYKK